MKSQVLSGCVESVEDHGYIVDIGIKGTNAFLPKKDKPNSQEGKRGCFKWPVMYWWCHQWLRPPKDGMLRFRLSSMIVLFLFRAEGWSVCDLCSGGSKKRRAGGPPFCQPAQQRSGLRSARSGLDPHQPSARASGSRYNQKGPKGFISKIPFHPH